MRVGSLFVLVFALVLGGIAAFLARSYLQSQTAPQPVVQPVNRTVVVAGQALPFGTPLTADNTLEVQWPAHAVVPGTFATKAELLKEGRRIVLSSMAQHEPILGSKITGPGQRASLSTLIEDGMRAVTIRVDDVRGVAGFILPNDRVDVVLTRGRGDGHAFADVLLQNVKVLAIDQIIGDKADKPTVARAVTLELDAQQAQKVILAEGIGHLSLILAKAGNAEAAVTRRVTTADLGPAGPVIPPVAVAQDDDYKDQIARLEARIEELRREAEKNGASEREVFMKRIADLEATLQEQLRARKVEAPAPAPIVRDPNKIVNVVRNGSRREQYNVTVELMAP